MSSKPSTPETDFQEDNKSFSKILKEINAYSNKKIEEIIIRLSTEISTNGFPATITFNGSDESKKAIQELLKDYISDNLDTSLKKKAGTPKKKRNFYPPEKYHELMKSKDDNDGICPRVCSRATATAKKGDMCCEVVPGAGMLEPCKVRCESCKNMKSKATDDFFQSLKFSNGEVSVGEEELLIGHNKSPNNVSPESDAESDEGNPNEVVKNFLDGKEQESVVTPSKAMNRGDNDDNLEDLLNDLEDIEINGN